MNDFQIGGIEEMEYNPDSIEKKPVEEKRRYRVKGIKSPHEFLKDSTDYKEENK